MSMDSAHLRDFANAFRDGMESTALCRDVLMNAVVKDSACGYAFYVFSCN